MKTIFPGSSVPERSRRPAASLSADPRVTALLFAGLLAASFYGEALRWNDRQGAAVSPTKTVAVEKTPPAVTVGC
jgi:hypothetical protein